MCNQTGKAGESVIGRYLSDTPRSGGTPLSRRWWSFPEEDGAEPTPARILIGTSIGLATTVVAFLVPQTLLIAIAFGTADYTSGRAGGIGFTLLSVLVVGFACSSGAFVAARELRRAELDQLDSLRTALVPPALVAVGIAVHGLIGGGGWPGFLLLLGTSLPAIAFSARWGAR
ncbi:hypothetical protein [Kineosporia babensis]|uniref:Uncharacterized protein n=1 Tax=Kineosporia babensis TaxID=499548 RepID=A0A9X1N9Q7_9ACTN|nr:hypothetical protein [Kineosporia babensis]MCD5309754.1 hypothetical protein [Kineosporia babensis]